MRRCLFLADEVDPPLAKPLEMVLIVSLRGGSVGVHWCKPVGGRGLRVGLGVCRGESRGEAIGGQNGERDWIG